jgi:Ca-activated chloride channel family protein
MFFEQEYYFSGFIFVALLGVLFWAYTKRKKRIRNLLGDRALIANLTKNYNHGGFLLKNFLLIAAFAGLLFCIANLQKPGGTANITRNGLDIICILDVSKSMLANDIQPSRLDRAKHFLVTLEERMPENKYGLILFAGNAYLQSPLSSDLVHTRLLIENAEPASVPSGGSKLGEALSLCGKAFYGKDRKYKVAIVVSDGESHDANSYQMARELKDSGILVYTIGMGTTNGSAIPDMEHNDFKKDLSGHTVITKLTETILKGIAEISQGRYFYFTDTESVIGNLKKEFATLGSKKIIDQTFVQYTSFYYWFAIFSFLCIVASFFVPLTRKNV